MDDSKKSLVSREIRSFRDTYRVSMRTSLRMKAVKSFIFINDQLLFSSKEVVVSDVIHF